MNNIIRNDEKLAKILLANSQLKKAKELMESIDISTQSIDDNIKYLQNKETEVRELIRNDLKFR